MCFLCPCGHMFSHVIGHLNYPTVPPPKTVAHKQVATHLEFFLSSNNNPKKNPGKGKRRKERDPMYALCKAARDPWIVQVTYTY